MSTPSSNIRAIHAKLMAARLDAITNDNHELPALARSAITRAVDCMGLAASHLDDAAEMASEPVPPEVALLRRENNALRGVADGARYLLRVDWAGLFRASRGSVPAAADGVLQMLRDRLRDAEGEA